MSLMLVDCAGCRTPLQLPPGAKSIRCAICQTVTLVADSRSSPFPNGAYPPPHSPHALPALNPLQYAPSAPPTHGSKKAVICGITYRYSRHELKGCINDAKCMRHFLITKYHFPESSILMLTEEERDPLKIPTLRNMRMAMYWLVQGCQPGDSLVFHYSGHGSQQRNLTGEEVDGYDETLCPVDFETQGMLVDDEINATLVRPLPTGVRLHALIDSCHSGTALDLPFVCKFDSYGRFAWEDHRPRTGRWTGTSGGMAFSFSGCDDDQTSADTSALSKVTSTGAMTYCFIQAVERGANTYGSILHSMRAAIRDVSSSSVGSGPVTSLIQMLLTGGSLGMGLTQEPQLSASSVCDINVPFYL